MSIYLSLGTNLGNKRKNLKQAINFLNHHQNIKVKKISPIYMTSPVSKVKQANFLNCALKINTTLNPEELLTLIHKIETDLHRVRTIHWGPRTIDIDIIFWGNKTINTTDLTVPHPQTYRRLFVLKPLLDIIDTKSTYKQKIKETINQLKNSSQKIKKFPNLTL